MKHIVFDVDGTLVDTAYGMLHSLQDALLEMTGKEYPIPELNFALAMPAVESMKIFGINPPEAGFEKWVEKLKGYAHTITTFPGIPELLESLKGKGYALGVVTSRTRDVYEMDARTFGFDACFGCTVCKEDAPAHKPAPDPLRVYAEKTGADMADLVYVGDSPCDLECAAAAGVRFILAGWGTTYEFPESVCRAESPEDVEILLEKQ